MYRASGTKIHLFILLLGNIVFRVFLVAFVTNGLKKRFLIKILNIVSNIQYYDFTVITVWQKYHYHGIVYKGGKLRNSCKQL